MSDVRKQSWWRWLRWPLALAVLAWLVLPNLESLQNLLSQGIDWWWLLAALGLRFVSLLLAAVRWNLLLAGQGIRPPAARVARMVGIGYVCNFVLPGTIGGDVAKAGLIAADTPDRRKRALATVPLDRALGLLAFLLVGTIAGLVRWAAIPSAVLRSTVLVMGAISGIGLAALLLVLLAKFSQIRPKSVAAPDITTRLQKMFRTLQHGAEMLRRARGTVLVAILLGMVGHVSLCSASFCCLQAFRAADLPVTWGDQLWLVPAAEVPTAFLSLPGGLGAREGALAYFYGELSADSSSVALFRGIGMLVGGNYSLVCITLALLVGVALALTWQSASGKEDERAIVRAS